MVRHIISIIILFFLTNCVSAQNWSLISPVEKYNYCYNSGIIHTTIWVDSIEFDNTDSVYYLNRLVEKIAYDTILMNRPVFLQREIKFQENFAVFTSPGQYIIPLEINYGDQWVFDSTNVLTAAMTEIYPDQVLGIPDSVKKIIVSDTLSNQYTILISKSFGIITFPDFKNAGSYYHLIGLETAELGEQMPMAREIYDPHIADKYYYFTRAHSTTSIHYFWNDKHTQYVIVDVVNLDTIFNFQIKGSYMKRSYAYGHIDTSFGFINDTIGITPEILQLYNNQLFLSDYSYLGDLYEPMYYIMDTAYNSPAKTNDGSKYRIMSGDTLISAAANIQENEFYKYVTGIGKVYYKLSNVPDGLVWHTNESLEAYKKNGISHGEFMDDCDLLSQEVKSGMKITTNDTAIALDDTIVLMAAPGFDSYSWWVTGNTGHQDTIIASEYGPGSHEFGVEIEYYDCLIRDSIEIGIDNFGLDSSGIPHVLIMWMKSRDEVIIKNLSTKNLDIQVQIFDQTGRIVFNKDHLILNESDQEIIDIDHLTKGVYIVRSATANATYTLKIIH